MAKQHPACTWPAKSACPACHPHFPGPSTHGATLPPPTASPAKHSDIRHAPLPRHIAPWPCLQAARKSCDKTGQWSPTSCPQPLDNITVVAQTHIGIQRSLAPPQLHIVQSSQHVQHCRRKGDAAQEVEHCEWHPGVPVAREGGGRGRQLARGAWRLMPGGMCVFGKLLQVAVGGKQAGSVSVQGAAGRGFCSRYPPTSQISEHNPTPGRAC